MLNREETNTNFIGFGLTRTGTKNVGGYFFPHKSHDWGPSHSYSRVTLIGTWFIVWELDHGWNIAQLTSNINQSTKVCDVR